jgi:glycerol-3-phosphate dehydrogenase (NAD(P)+)
MNISIIWAWAFWYALAQHLWNNNTQLKINLYDIDKNIINKINKNKEHPHFFPWHKLPNNIKISDKISQWLQNSEIVFIAIPAQFIQDFLLENKNNFKHWITIINCAKWIDNKTIKTIGQLTENILSQNSNKIIYNYWVLSWWMIASDIINWSHIWADLAINHWGIWKQLVDMIQTDKFDINLVEWDILNIELHWSFKHILAVRAGYWQTKNVSYSSLWYYITVMSQELKQVIKILWWVDKLDAWQYSWIWDVIATCFGPSRNKEFWELIWQWKNIDTVIDIMQEKNRHAEGYPTLKAIYKIIKDEEWFENIKQLYSICK